MTSTEATTATVTGRAIQNPVLAGFHPDPSILRVGSDYYIATSTFEWYPGVRLHHSANLVDWTPLGGVLTDKRLLDLTGAADSGGVWAPSLTYAHGEFHLLYTDVSTFAVNIITLIGLGLSIDYALFVVSRFRDELAEGASRDEAVVRTMLSAGRTVIFSATTVALSMASASCSRSPAIVHRMSRPSRQ